MGGREKQEGPSAYARKEEECAHKEGTNESRRTRSVKGAACESPYSSLNEDESKPKSGRKEATKNRMARELHHEKRFALYSVTGP